MLTKIKYQSTAQNILWDGQAKSIALEATVSPSQTKLDTTFSLIDLKDKIVLSKFTIEGDMIVCHMKEFLTEVKPHCNLDQIIALVYSTIEAIQATVYALEDNIIDSMKGVY